jgi:hypothetical protein
MIDRLSDPQNQAILKRNMAAFDKNEGPRVGDYVRFSCGTMRRISYHWGDSVQTSAGGSFYLGDGYISFSGCLYRSVPVETLTPTDERQDGTVWFPDRDWLRADCAVYARVPLRVFTCSEQAPD